MKVCRGWSLSYGDLTWLASSTQLQGVASLEDANSAAEEVAAVRRVA